MAAYQNQFRQAEERFIAENRARAQQKIHDFENFRQKQREQKFWDERAAYTKRVTTPPKVSKTEAPILVPGHPPIFEPDESQQGESGKAPARCFSAYVEDFVTSMLGYAFTGAMWAYVAITVMPWLYASSFSRALLGVGTGVGLSVDLAAWIVCGIEFLVLCRVARWVAKGTASCTAWILVLPVAFLEAGVNFVFRRKTS